MHTRACRLRIDPLAGVFLAVALAFACGRPSAPARARSKPQAAGTVSAPRAPLAPRARRVRELYLAGLDSLAVAATGLERAAAEGPAAGRAAFRRARLAYKRIEALAEYYSPRTARAV